MVLRHFSQGTQQGDWIGWAEQEGMGAMRWNVHSARRTRVENVRLLPAAQIKRPP